MDNNVCIGRFAGYLLTNEENLCIVSRIEGNKVFEQRTEMTPEEQKTLYEVFNRVSASDSVHTGNIVKHNGLTELFQPVELSEENNNA